LHGKGVTDRSGYLLKASSALLSAGLTQNEILTILTDPETFLGDCAFDHARTKNRLRAAEWVYRYTFKKTASEKTEVKSVFANAPIPSRKLSKEEIEAQSKEILEERNWRQDLDMTEKGKIRPTLKNMDIIFSNEVGGVFREDLFASRIE